MENVHNLKKTWEREVQTDSCAEVPTPKHSGSAAGGRGATPPPRRHSLWHLYVPGVLARCSLFLNEKVGLTHGFLNLWLHFCDLGNLKVSS